MTNQEQKKEENYPIQWQNIISSITSLMVGLVILYFGYKSSKPMSIILGLLPLILSITLTIVANLYPGDFAMFMFVFSLNGTGFIVLPLLVSSILGSIMYFNSGTTTV